MILRRVAGPRPRIVALHQPHLAPFLLVVALIAGCGAAVPANSTGSAGPGSPSPVGSSAPDAGLSAGPDASQPRWPAATVLAVLALGGADAELQKAGADLQRAADAQDLKAMWGAADGLAKLTDALAPNVGRLDAYEGTKPVAERYRAAFGDIGGGAKQLRDSITSGDAARIVAGSQRIAKGLQTYAPIRREIAVLVQQALVQQRFLVR